MTPYTPISPAARDSFLQAQIHFQQLGRCFSGNFTTADALKLAVINLDRAVKSLGDVREMIG